MDNKRAINYELEIPDVLQQMSNVHNILDTYRFDRSLYHLVLLRASQINRCGYCVKLHTKDARENGETSERLDSIVVWDHVEDFNEREKAALAWTEVLTRLDQKSDFGILREQLREHFSEKEIGFLTSTIAMINLWNRIRISGH